MTNNVIDMFDWKRNRGVVINAASWERAGGVEPDKLHTPYLGWPYTYTPPSAEVITSMVRHNEFWWNLVFGVPLDPPDNDKV